MSLKTIAGQDYEDVCVFQSDKGDNASLITIINNALGRF